MEKELKDAIVTIAEYNDPLAIIIYVESDDELYDTQATWPFRLLFHTSADCLLPVYRKVKNQFNEAQLHQRLMTYQIMDAVGRIILSGDFPAACIKLAEIIKQLKNG